MTDWIPIIIVMVGVQLIIRGVLRVAFRGRADDEEELVTYEYMTVSTYWDDMAALLTEAAETDWEAFEVFAPDGDEDDGSYRILLRKEKL